VSQLGPAMYFFFFLKEYTSFAPFFVFPSPLLTAVAVPPPLHSCFCVDLHLTPLLDLFFFFEMADRFPPPFFNFAFPSVTADFCRWPSLPLFPLDLPLFSPTTSDVAVVDVFRSFCGRGCFVLSLVVLPTPPSHMGAAVMFPSFPFSSSWRQSPSL